MGALKTSSLEAGAKRVLLSGAKYLYPEPQEKLSPFDAAGLKERTENFLAAHTEGSGDVAEEYAKFLFENVAGLALSTAREMVKRYPHGTPIWEFVGEFCAREPCLPCLLTENGAANGKPLDFFAFPVEGGIPMPSLNKAEDEYYYRKETKRTFEDKKRKLESAVRALKKKQQKTLQDMLERLKDCEGMDLLRIRGELLTANLYRLEKGMKEAELENWYAPEGGRVKIALDTQLSPSQNAQKYFKAYAKQKRTREALTPRKQKEEEEMEYTESLAASLSVAESAEGFERDRNGANLLRTRQAAKRKGGREEKGNGGALPRIRMRGL